MLKPAMILFGALVFLTGCASWPPQRNSGPPAPLNWDITRDDHPPLPPAPPPPPPPSAPADTDILETNHFEETWAGLDHWSEACGFAPVERLPLVPLEMTVTNGFQWNDLDLKARTALIPLPTFLLRTTNGVLTIQPETRTAYLNEVQFHLGFTPKLVQGELLLNALDLKKTIGPLLQNSPLPATNRTLVIDPDDDGGNFALDWAQRLAPLLATNGWKVFLTRTNDAGVAPADRAAFADVHPASLFLSLCFETAAMNEAQSGLETYCLTPAGMPSNVPQDQLEETWQTFPNNACDAENWQYAFRIHRALIHVPGAKDRGLRRSRFVSLLRDRTYPAVRVSGGYLSNAHDAALIANPLFRQKLAEAVAAALQ